LWCQRDQLKSLGIDVLFVSFEPLTRVREYSIVDGFGWPVLADEGGEAYRNYGLESASFVRAWLSPRTVWFYFATALHGTRIRKPLSDTSQVGGDFLIDPDGKITFAFRSVEFSTEQIPAARRTSGFSGR